MKGLDNGDAIAAFIQDRLFAGPGESLEAAYVFGSASRGETHSGSDLDIAFLGSQSKDPAAVFETAQDLALLIQRSVDLVDLRTASTVLRAQVVGTGRRIHAADEEAVDTFEMYALSDYARLEEERRELLQAFQERYRV